MFVQQREGKPLQNRKGILVMSTVTTTNTNIAKTAKIDLTAKATAYYASKRAAKRARSIAYVEETLLPQLVAQAESGSRYYSVKPPADVELNDVIEALQERANCKASCSGYNGKISVTW